MNGPRERKKVEHWQIIAVLLALYDFVAMHVAFFAALWIRFDCVYSAIPPQYLKPYMQSITIASVVSILLFVVFKMYRIYWQFASFRELARICMGTFIACVIYIIGITVFLKRMPLSFYIWGTLIFLMLVCIPRFSYRIFLMVRNHYRNMEVQRDNVMIIGAGSAGQMIMRDIQRGEELKDRVVCFIDDNPNKWNRSIEGIPIVGGRDDILLAVEKYKVDKIYLAIPSATAESKRDIINICKETKCELKQLPGLYQFVLGQISVTAMKNVEIEDLLGREPIKADMNEVFEFINDKVVLVTGGGGSIGSELCRQIAAHHPKQLIILDIYENNAYDIQLELREKHPELNLLVLIGSVRDSRKVYEIFEDYHPQIVYHAAAHKHVPLMEDSPCEAIKNNAIGTYKTAYAAMIHGCERFVLISTDKAVNPTNIMGASKRLCEMIIQSFDAKIKEGKANEIPQLFTHEGEYPAVDLNPEEIRTEFVAVRFGNVLGSNGSVIPIFKKQIENGGPVTVTHPDIIRYFMTIPEAVSLVMLAGTYAHGGEIFVLDMGTPVKIDTLARNLIKLSGFKPDVDIKIAYTGLRPGEKLYEEKLMAEEGLKRTENEMIHIGCPIPFEVDEFLDSLKILMEKAYNNKCDIREEVSKVVTTYHPATNDEHPGKDSEENKNE